jgi:N6-adenosine-specific RNA methylase IME4
MRYRTIVADPPWPVRQPPKTFRTGTRNSPLPYPTMSVAEITGLPVSHLAASSCHLYLWTVNRFARTAYDVVEGWGFTPAMLLTWCKEPRGIGPGRQFASTTEFILFAWRGPQEREPQRIERNWWAWPGGHHSEKPAAFQDIVEQVSPGPYLEMFARRQRLGWDTWGDEALSHVELESA